MAANEQSLINSGILAECRKPERLSACTGLLPERETGGGRIVLTGLATRAEGTIV